MPDPIDSLKIEISSSATNAVKSIDSLVNSLKSLKGVSDVSGTAKNLSKLANALQNLKGIGTISISKATADNLQKIVNVAGNVSDASISRINRLADAMGRLAKETSKVPNGLVGKALSQQSISNMPTQTPKTSGQTMHQSQPERISDESGTADREERVNGLARAFESLRGVGSRALHSINSMLSKVGSSLAKLYVASLKAFAWPFQKAISGLSGIGKRLAGVISAFKRIMFYRAIRTIIKGITQAVKEGVNNLYQYSKAFGGTFSKSMDEAATSMLYLKNSIGAMTAPLINALVPVLDVVVDKIVEFLNYINQLIAKLTGAATWTRALRYPKEYAAAADSAAGAAKKMKDYTLGFDELNVFNEDAGRGSGGGASTPDYSKMFEEVETFAEGIGDFSERIKQAIQNGDWEGVGKILAEKVNSLINKLDSSSIGKKIGTKLNNAIRLVSSFFSNTDFTKLGSALAKQISELIGQIKPGSIGELIANIINSGVNLVYGFLSKTDFESLGKRIAANINSAVSTIKANDIGKKLAAVVNSAANLAKGLLSDTDFGALGTAIGQTISDFISNINFATLAYDVTKLATGIGDMLINAVVNVNWGNVAKQLSTFLVSAFTNLSSWINAKDWKKVGEQIGTQISNFVKEVKWGDIAQSAIDLLSGALTAAGGLFVGVVSSIDWEDLGNKLWEGLKKTIEFLGKLVVVAVGGILNSLQTLIEAGIRQIPGVSDDFTLGFSFGNWAYEAVGLKPGATLSDIGHSVFGTGKPGATGTGGRDDYEYGPFSGHGGYFGKPKSDDDGGFQYPGESLLTIDESGAGEYLADVIRRAAQQETYKRACKYVGKDMAERIVKGFNLSEPISEEALSALGHIKEKFISLYTWTKAHVSIPIRNTLRNTFTMIANFAGTSVTTTKSHYRSLGSWFSEKVSGPIRNTFANTFGQKGQVQTSAASSASYISRVFTATQSDIQTNVVEKIRQQFTTLMGTKETSGSLASATASGVTNVENVFKDLMTWFQREVIGKMTQSMQGAFAAIGGLFGSKGVNGLGIVDIPARANGGLISSGELFLARENGINEMVGRIGNTSAVANNGQIEEGIARATERANERTVLAIYAIASQIVQAIEENSANVFIGDEEIGMANNRYQQKSGRNASKGAFANAY